MSLKYEETQEQLGDSDIETDYGDEDDAAEDSKSSVVPLKQELVQQASREWTSAPPKNQLAAWHLEILSTYALKPFTSPERHTVRRDVITQTVGGNGQAAFTRARDGHEHLFAKSDQNPFLPVAPGAPGLLFTFAWRAKGARVRFFVRDRVQPLWTYMGDYVQRAMRPLTREEWKIQPEAVKKMRAKSVAKRNSVPAKALKSRVADSKQLDDVSHDDVRAALDAGTESILLVALECMGFDAAFQQKLLAAAKGGPVASASKAKARPSPRTKSKASPASPAKRKRAVAFSEDEDHEEPQASEASSSRRRLPGRTARRRITYVENSDSE